MITLQQVSKTYGNQRNGVLSAVNGVTMEISQGTIHGIIGESGAGKSTLLRLINMLERPDEGQIRFSGLELTRMAEQELREIRFEMGMIFQHFHLLHNRTVEGNVKVPLELAKIPGKERERRAAECLAFMGLADKAKAYPAQLSGGQKQRVAIARALASSPKVLLCDEPTSALDPGTTADILEVLRSINREFGVTIVIVTHEMEVARRLCDEVSVMEEGRIIDHIKLGRLADDAALRQEAPKLSYREQLLGTGANEL